MPTPPPASGDEPFGRRAAPMPGQIEAQIDQWRSFLRRRQAIQAVDVSELEDHLREQMTDLVAAGLAADEAFLVAVKRMGNLDTLSREFAREHSDRLWKQLVVSPAPDLGEPGRGSRAEAFVAFALAVGAAAAVKLPQWFGAPIEGHQGFYLRNLSFFVLPLLAGYFVWKRRLNRSAPLWLGLVFVASAVLANAYPWAPTSATAGLTALHLPVMLWLVGVGTAYAGGRWRRVEGRMDLVRFSGEWFIYYVLIALGGAVVTALVALLFRAIGVNAQPFLASWQVPCGAAGAVLIAAWLVEAKQSVIENMAPVLARLFTPLLAAMLVAFLAALLWTGHGLRLDRNVLLDFNLLLVVLGVLLYSISARPPQAAPGLLDGMQVVLVLTALVADAVALWAIGARIFEFGYSANRAATLGINLILLINLSWSAVLYAGFLRRQVTFASLERWQTNYLTVYAIWAAAVVVVFPPLFGYR